MFWLTGTHQHIMFIAFYMQLLISGGQNGVMQCTCYFRGYYFFWHNIYYLLGGNGLCAWGESIDVSVIIVDQLISYCGVAAVGSMCTVRIGECVCGRGGIIGGSFVIFVCYVSVLFTPSFVYVIYLLMLVPYLLWVTMLSVSLIGYT